MREKFIEGLQEKWDQCGSDLLRSVNGEFDYRKEPKATMTRDAVFDACADLYVGGLARDGEESKAWFAMTFEEAEELKKLAFPFNVYGY